MPTSRVSIPGLDQPITTMSIRPKLCRDVSVPSADCHAISQFRDHCRCPPNTAGKGSFRDGMRGLRTEARCAVSPQIAYGRHHDGRYHRPKSIAPLGPSAGDQGAGEHTGAGNYDMPQSGWHDMTEVDDSFAMPQHGLFADVDTGTGCVRFTDDFKGIPAVQRARIIADWRRDLLDAERGAILELFEDARSKMTGLSPDEQIARFRGLCLSVGIAIPDDLAKLLGE